MVKNCTIEELRWGIELRRVQGQRTESKRNYTEILWEYNPNTKYFTYMWREVPTISWGLLCNEVGVSCAQIYTRGHGKKFDMNSDHLFAGLCLSVIDWRIKNNRMMELTWLSANIYGGDLRSWNTCKLTKCKYLKRNKYVDIGLKRKLFKHEMLPMKFFPSNTSTLHHNQWVAKLSM